VLFDKIASVYFIRETYIYILAVDSIFISNNTINIRHFTCRVSVLVMTASVIHRATVTQFLSISMPAGFRRHLVGETFRNVCYSAVT